MSTSEMTTEIGDVQESREDHLVSAHKGCITAALPQVGSGRTSKCQLGKVCDASFIHTHTYKHTHTHTQTERERHTHTQTETERETHTQTETCLLYTSDAADE